MGWFKKLKKAVKKAAPKIKIGKDLGMKNIGKGATAAYKTAGKFGSEMTRTLGKGAEGIVANTNDIGAKLAQGDFKGMGKEALELIQSGKDIIKGNVNAYSGLGTGAVGALGTGTGSENIVKAASDVDAESRRGVDKYADTAIDMGISAIPGVGQGYALAKMAASGLAQGGIGGLTDPKLLAQLGTSAIASKFGVDPTLLSGASALAQGKGLKGAALQAAGSYGGLSADNAAMLGDLAGGDVKSALMNRAGAAAGLTGAQTGVGKALLGDGNLVSSLAAAGGEKAGLSAANQGLIGQVASGDLRGAALAKMAGATGLDPNILKQVSTGKFDVGELAKNANLTASLGGMAQSYLPGSVSNMIDGAKSAGRVVEQGDAAAAFMNDAKSAQGDESVVKAEDMKKAAESTYKIAKGDTLGAIAKRMGVDVKALAAANGIKDINKISAGMNLKMPGAVSQAADADQDLSGKIGAGVIESGQVTQATFDANRAFQDWSKSQTGYIGKEKKAFMQDLFNKRASGQVSNDDFAKQMKSQGEKGFLDKAKDAVTGAVGAAGGFIKENPNAANALLQGAAGIGGYMAGDKARDAQEALIEKQILETKGIDELKKYKLGKEYEKAYSEQQTFIGDTIAGGGRTAKQREMRHEGYLRSARADAAGRMSGSDLQARMGQGVTGTGSGYASSLVGGQSGSNIRAESERAAATSAEDNLEKAYGTRTSALENKAATEINLAQSKDNLDLNKQKDIALQRIMQGNLELAEGNAKGKLISSIADSGSDLIYSNSTAAEANQKYDNRIRQAELQKRENEANGMVLAQTQQSPQQNQPTPQQNQQGNRANQQVPQQNTAKGGALASLANPQGSTGVLAPAPASLANPQGSTGVLAPAPKSTTPAMDAMNNFLSVPKLPTAGQAIANPQAAAKGLIDQKAAQAKQIATDLAKKKAAELQASLAAKAKSTLPASVASAGSKLISNFKIPGLS